MTLTKPKRVRSPSLRRSRSAEVMRDTDGANEAQGLSGSRREVLISEAARLFASKGYENTSMRDIAAAIGILPGSLYHHFPSKEDLFVAVYSFAVAQTLDVVTRAIASHDDPWARLEAACVAHLRSLLEKSRFAAVLVSHPALDNVPPREQAIALRDRYEAVFKDLVADLPLPADIDRQIFRLGLLGSLNWAINWYRPGGETPAVIAKKLLAAIRRQ
jgi:TetR/AcrR family transcriptional regulator, cholesterol catabolism regulator